MKRYAWIFAVLLGTVMVGSAADSIRITATKKLDNRRQSSAQRLPGGATSLTQKEYLYHFDIQSLSTLVPSNAVAEWIVYMEDWTGRIRPMVHDKQDIELRFGTPVAVETDTVHLNERDWSHRGGSGKLEDKVAGYAIRIMDKDGNLLTERSEPASIRKEVDWSKADAEKNMTPQQRQEMQRKLERVQAERMRHK